MREAVSQGAEEQLSPSMQWTAPTTVIAMCRISVVVEEWRVSPVLTPRQSRLVSTSGMAPASDIQMAMSGFELISSAMPSASDVSGSLDVRGLLTQSV